MANANRNVVKAAKFREVLQAVSSFDGQLEATNQKLTDALELLVQQAGGDMSRLSEEQQSAFGDALGGWFTEMIEEL